jgi:hypothetical protein
VTWDTAGDAYLAEGKGEAVIAAGGVQDRNYAQIGSDLERCGQLQRARPCASAPAFNEAQACISIRTGRYEGINRHHRLIASLPLFGPTRNWVSVLPEIRNFSTVAAYRKFPFLALASRT